MQENNIPVSTNASIIDQAQFEADKRAVYKHPLFSLLALMLEKCEQATQGYIPKSSSSTTPSSSSPNGTSNGESDSFTKDIQAFVQMLEKENRPLLTNNAELDGLMIKALQVLRIHLLELEKVQELCRDFCTRYIACLRGKMQSENLLRSDYPLEHNNNLSNSNSPVHTPDHESLSGQQSNFFPNNDFLGGNKLNDFSSIQGFIPSHANNSITSDHNTFANELNNMPNVALPTSLVGNIGDGGHSPNHNTMISSQILGSTPLNQIGCNLPIDPYAADQLSPCNSSDEGDSEIDSINDDLSSNLSTNSGSKRQKRGILPKQATSVMRAWLFQHLVHPYPTEDEKRAIAAQTNLTLLQVNNWFINARRRILQPMLEHANDSNQHNPDANSGNETHSSKKSNSPYLTTANAAATQPINDRGTENTNPNMLCSENERLLMLQRFASNNYCSSDESDDSFGTENKQSNQ